MEHLEIEKILKASINKFGAESQVMILFEEMGELMQAISKYKRNPCAETLQNVIDEMADVTAMLQKNLLVFDPNDVLFDPAYFRTINKIKKVVL
jgi:hypothetical protein